MERKKNILYIIPIVLTVVIVVVVVLIKRNNGNSSNVVDDFNMQNQLAITTLKELDLTETNQEIEINNKKINVRAQENTDMRMDIFINDKKVSSAISSYILYTDYFIVVTINSSKSGEFYQLYDENGKKIEIIEYTNSPFKNMHIEYEKLKTIIGINCSSEGKCEDFSVKEVIYDGKKIKLINEKESSAYKK